MTHSQYFLPALPDLLKSHRLSYKKFLHNGIDEEFDLLSAKTELNEEEIFYEGLKLNHIDELSPSQVESLDYIYHAEEKIFLVPKRTLEDSLRGRQSHSFHLFIPLEVKILPFQDELDPSHFGANFVSTAANKVGKAANEIDSFESSSTLLTSLEMNSSMKDSMNSSMKDSMNSSMKASENDKGGPADELMAEPTSLAMQPTDVFFRGGSGSPLSEAKKEFFQTALSFFFQQPKIQKIVITTRFLLLRWFCEKLQHIEPSFISESHMCRQQPMNLAQSQAAPAIKVGQDPTSWSAVSSDLPDQVNFTFAKFDFETKTKLYQIYQKILLKFEKQTQKSPLKFTNFVGDKQPTDPTKLGVKRVKVFQKTSRWVELMNHGRVLMKENGLSKTANERGSNQVIFGQPTSLAADANPSFKSPNSPGKKFRFPRFPHFPIETDQDPFSSKNLLQSQSNVNFLPFNKNFPTNGVEQPTSWANAANEVRSHMLAPFRGSMPGFHSKTSGLTAGRKLVRGNRSPEPTSLPGDLSRNSGRSQSNWLQAEMNSSAIRFGTVENTKRKTRENFSRRALRSRKLSQRVTFIRRIVQAIQIKNQKKKLHEIFVAIVPALPERKGLRFWKGQNPTGSLTCRKSAMKPKFLKHFKVPLQKEEKSEREFHFLSPRQLQKIVKPGFLDELMPTKLAFREAQTTLTKQSPSGQTFPRRTKQSWVTSSARSNLSKFLSLPQNELGSLWKILPKMGSVQCYQLQKLAYRQRNMLMLNTGPTSLASHLAKPRQHLARGAGSGSRKGANSVGNKVDSRSLKAPSALQTPLKGKKTSLKSAKGGSSDENRTLEKPQKLVAGRGKILPLSAKPTRTVKKLNSAKKIFPTATNQVRSFAAQQKLHFDRFFLKSKDRKALHSQKTFALRAKGAWRMEKKSAKLQLFPGLEFWEKYHSEKRIEEYWEALLQPYRKKFPSKLLVSIPSGNVVFVKSEKDSRPTEVKRNGAQKVGSSLSSQHSVDRTVNKMLWIYELQNMKFFMKNILAYSPAKLEFFWKYRFRFLWQALSEPIEQSTPVQAVQRSWPEPATQVMDSGSKTGSKTGSRVGSKAGNKVGNKVGNVATEVGKEQPTKWSPLRGGQTQKFRSTRVGSLALVERQNLPKVCSDLRELLSSFHELLCDEIHHPQKFFISGQVGKKEWPFQKDGSKSYFALLNLGKMPFMTKQGHFLINGSARVLVSQIAKCPNFYTKMKIDSRGRPRYWTEFVSSFKNAGEWIQFHIDLENKMFFSLGTKRKYSIFIFLGALGISPSEIPDVIEHWDFLKQSLHQEEILIDQNQNFLTYLVEPLEVREARILFHDTQNYSFFPGSEKTDEELQKFFEDIFYNPSRYFLGHAGREALNQRRRFSGTPSRSRALEKEDFLAAINALIEVRLGLAPPDDIDHLKFRRVRLPGELLQNEFHLALDEIFTLDFTKFREGPLPGDALDPHPKDQRRTIFPTLYDLEQKIFEKGRPFAVSKTVGIQSTYQVSPLEKRMKNFFHTGQLSQYMDQTNPLAEITHKRRLTSLGPDGLPKQVGVAVRELHPSHFGRICPIETPEGLNAGLVASLSSQAKIGSHHTLLAPYYWVKDRTREFPQKIFNNEIFAGSTETGSGPLMRSTTGGPTSLAPANEMGSMTGEPTSLAQHPTKLGMKWAHYPPVLPEIVFLSASAEDSVYICSEDYWFSSKYKNFETLPAPLPTGAHQGGFLESTALTAADERGSDLKWEHSTKLGPEGERSPLRGLLQGNWSSPRPTSLAADEPLSLAVFPSSTQQSWVQIDSKNSLVKFQTVFPARYQQEFFTVTKSQIDFFAICPTQMISVGTSLIPFLEHDDANRALMGSNMQRQALPLLVLERPLVGTGSEKGVAQSSNSVLLSEFSGQVSFADGRKIVVDSFPKKITSFPETFNTKNSRLLLGSSERVFHSTGQDSSQQVDGAGNDPQEVLDFGHRNLFQKFQNRTEDGKVKTIRRIFTVKIQIPMPPKFQRNDDQKHDQPTKRAHANFSAPFRGSCSNIVGSMTRRAGTPSVLGVLPKAKFFTVIKVFPISDEEYEKSRNLLRREFLKKYKEIHHKKVFPLGFWPGERWKKTGESWNLRGGLLQKTTESPKKQPTKLTGRQPTNLAAPDQTAFELKRVRYQKAQLGGQSRIRTQRSWVLTRPKTDAPLHSDPTVPHNVGLLSALDSVQQLTKWVPNTNGSISPRAQKFFEKTGQTMSNFILRKKTLRSSILPAKAGSLFFEPTPQMIFKNILSKNSKKREILRKAFLQKSFLPYHFDPTSVDPTSVDPTSVDQTSVDPTSVDQTSLGARSTGNRHEKLETAVGKHPMKWGTVNAIGTEQSWVSSFGGLTRKAGNTRGVSRSNLSWSVSMKKVTPYTQVTYNIHGYWRTNQNTLRRQRPAVHAGDWVAAGDLLADSSATLRGELCVGQNILVGYVPWEGYNFEDAIVVNERLVEEDIYTSILIDRYEMEAAIDAGEKITRKIPDIKPHLLKNLDIRGIISVGTWVEEDDILVGKILPVTTELQGYSKLLADIYQISPPVAKDVSFRVPDRISGRILECSVSEMIVRTPENQAVSTPWKVTLYLVEKRRMKLGDKMSGRHGNKGIVSIILPPQDMPFLPDGTALDVALNPLGVPSRMNVGQLLESLLGLAGKHLHQKYRIPAFDEMYGEDFSRRIVYDKLLEASQKTQKPWLFNPNFPGKMMLRDGRTGEYFHQPILVGYPYMLKLIHMVDDKMHARSTGPYTMVTQQPLKGRANRGGQRIGEMEVWAVEAFSASYALQELLTLKSDDISGRNHFLMSFLKRKKRTVGGIPDAFRVLMHELQSLCFHVHYTEDYRLTYPTLLESSNIPETPLPGNYGRGS